MLNATKRPIVPSVRSDVPPFMVMDVMAAAGRIEAAGGRVIHMEVGQPAAPAPASAIAAAQAALAVGRIAYTEMLGLPTLRARIARHYGETYGIEIDPMRVAVTTGSSAGFILVFLSLFDRGDRVAVALPGYPPYRNILAALGCEAVPIETTQATRWSITPEMLFAVHRKKPLQGVLIASPANPTGTMMTPEALRDLCAAAEGEGIRFISDEIYHGLDYAFAAETIARFSSDALIINSFSKYFCMTGWRIGWTERRLRTDFARGPHAHPAAFRHLLTLMVGNREVEVREEPAAAHALRHALAFQEGRRCGCRRACSWWRRSPAISRRCCAQRCALCCPSTTCSLPIGIALRSRSLRGGAHRASRQSGAAAKHDADGRADRLPGQPDQGQ